MPELRVTCLVKNVTRKRTWGKSNVKVTTTGNRNDARTVNIGTTEETFVISTDVGNNCYCYLENYDSTNFVKVGFLTGVYYIRLKPGEPNAFRLEPGVTEFKVIADTAACDVFFAIEED